MSMGFNSAMGWMAAGLAMALIPTLVLPGQMGKMKVKPSLSSILSKSQGINVLSLARFFLFGARDVWFVVALPVFLEEALGWNFSEIGGFLGLWVVGTGSSKPQHRPCDDSGDKLNLLVPLPCSSGMPY